LQLKFKLSDDDVEKLSSEELAKNYEGYMNALENDYDIDPTKFFIFSRDLFWVDCGLIIARPAIFMHMDEMDRKFMK